VSLGIFHPFKGEFFERLRGRTMSAISASGATFFEHLLPVLRK
jgi:hypothetical protein